MNSSKQCVIYERSKIIPIQPTSPTNKKENFFDVEYSLVQNLFDPSKSSPPNEFLLKLKLRMSLYDTFINDDNRITE